MTLFKGKRMIWILAILAVAALAVFGIWRWAMANQSVATLDRVDQFFDGGAAELVSGPVSLGDHDDQRLYVWRPANVSSGASLPVLVFVHGGGWHAGYPGDYAFVGRNLAPEGFLVINAGYRLGEAGKFPAMLEDSAAAIKWASENAANFGGDPQQIFAMGHSAGAYNVAMLALDRQWLEREGLPDDTLKGVIGLAGPYDFLPFDSDSTINAFGDWDKPDETQPITFARADAPPMLLATGSADTTVRPRNSRVLAEKLTELGTPTQPVIFDGLSHERIIMNLARPFARDPSVKQAIVDFIRRHAQADLAAPRDVSAPVQTRTG